MATVQPPHLLLYPYTTSGHVIPILDLAHHLLTRGLTLTILVTPPNLPLLDPLLTSHPSLIHPLLFPAPEFPSSLNPSKRLISSTKALQNLHHPILLQWFRSHPSPPVAIVSDIFLGWTHHLAVEVNVRRIVFSPSGAFSQSHSFSLWRDLMKFGGDGDLDFPVTFPAVPNAPTYPLWQISVHYRNYTHEDEDLVFFRNGMLANMASWGIVYNSFTELERVYIDYIMKEVGHNRVWAVGPLLPPGGDTVGPFSRGGSSSVQTDVAITWLDSHPDKSVVYVCFGSRVVLTMQQMDELVAAVEISGVRFILCVREPSNAQINGGNYGIIPNGFEDRVAGRGFVIKGWAPQVAILRHRAVGSFLTHCGWNSTLEGIAAGMVMLTWPMSADQFANAKLIVEQLGVGIRVGEGIQKIPSSAELATILTDSLDMTRCDRIRIKKLSEAALDAVGEGGSSYTNLNELVKSVCELKLQNGNSC